MHPPYLEITVIFLAVLRVALPIIALLAAGELMDRRECRHREGAI